MAEETTLEDLVAQEEASEEETQTAEEATEEATEEAEETEATEDTEEESGEEEASEEPTGDIFSILDQTGYDFRSKYQTPEAAIEGIKNMVASFGKRYEAAVEAQQLREKLGEEEYKRLLEGGTPPLKQEVATDEVELPARWEEMQVIIDAARQENASSETVSKAKKLVAEWERRLWERATAPDVSTKKMAELEAKIAALEKTTTETTAQTAREAWTAEHATEIYAEGKLNPLGQKVNSILQTDPEMEDYPDGVPRLNAALWKAKASMPKAKPTKKAPKTAQHQKAGGRGDDELRTDQEQMEADLERLDPVAYMQKWAPSLGGV